MLGAREHQDYDARLHHQCDADHEEHDDCSSECDSSEDDLVLDSARGNKRALRAAVRQQTVKILGRGGYRARDGTWVDVAARAAAAVDGTTMRVPSHQLVPCFSGQTAIEVVEEGTLGAALRLHRAGHDDVCALNFA